ncbi:MAG TPA: hypothetical protein VEA80_03470 [Vitreimonas sp.]|uniref:hypothetical protein n=1 Tax=Vitreimonas sp. TaxID=3069702 RepID=UPI002D597FEA|nr:hypothetical protein [Vitreimonas sp.]HYD86508.1 hypothetical protein [Vitreimonas sp.]
MTDAEPSPLQKARIFSRYAYVPEPDWSVLRLFADDVFAEQKREFAARSIAELFKLADAQARAVFADAFDGLSGDIVIPLSGGRDSRFILAMALEAGLGPRVTTLTWGVPGGLDFEIGPKIARYLGVRHESVNVLATPLKFEDLQRAYDTGGRWTDLVFAHYNRVWRSIAPGAQAVIGYLGGPPVGCHYKLGDEHLDLDAAVAAFEAVNRRMPRGAPMFGDVRDRLIGAERVSLPEQLDLVFRQEGYLRRIVASHSADVRTPFAHPQWLRFMYALPGRLRDDSRFFSAYLQQRFPRAFSLGVAKSYGARANGAVWERRAMRQLVKLSHTGANAFRERGFRTFDKYGDARDLCLLLTPGGGPHAYERLLTRRPQRPTISQAADWRLHAMLIANLLCSGVSAARNEVRAA